MLFCCLLNILFSYLNLKVFYLLCISHKTEYNAVSEAYVQYMLLDLALIERPMTKTAKSESPHAMQLTLKSEGMEKNLRHVLKILFFFRIKCFPPDYLLSLFSIISMFIMVIIFKHSSVGGVFF